MARPAGDQGKAVGEGGTPLAFMVSESNRMPASTDAWFAVPTVRPSLGDDPCGHRGIAPILARATTPITSRFSSLLKKQKGQRRKASNHNGDIQAGDKGLPGCTPEIQTGVSWEPCRVHLKRVRILLLTTEI